MSRADRDSAIRKLRAQNQREDEEQADAWAHLLSDLREALEARGADEQDARRNVETLTLREVTVALAWPESDRIPSVTVSTPDGARLVAESVAPPLGALLALVDALTQMTTS